MTDRPVYTPETLAERWHITVKVVEEQLRRGELSGFKVGRRWRITAAAVEAHETRRSGGAH